MKSNSNTPGVVEPQMSKISREQYDLSHWSFQIGSIGCLQTLSCIPVIAGDSLDINASVVFRLGVLRRNLYLDANVDLFAFYVPHRHIYGSDWTDFIKAGVDESVSLGTDTPTSGVDLNCLGLRTEASAVLPRWLTRGYIQIWNRYFRDPSDVSGVLAEDFLTTLGPTDRRILVGISVAHLKSLSTTTVLSTLTTGDYRLPLDTGEVNLNQLEQLKGRLKTELAREWFALYYDDILKHSVGSGVNTDADKRPTLLMRGTGWMSGYDVDGTDDSSLGTYSGKAQAIRNLRVPNRFFPEHGAVWIMAVVRFPYVHALETHYLVRKPNPTYAEIAGDPEVIARQPQLALNFNEVFASSSSVALGDIPHSHWYRMHPNFVNRVYDEVAGHPFLLDVPANRNAQIYIDFTEYDNIFQSLQMYHWNSQGHISVTARRYVPGPLKSVFSAAN